MGHWQDRTKMVIGEDGCLALGKASVMIFGVGGVGSYAAEALARSGVGHIALVDADSVSLSNINRQLIALHSTVGDMKVDVCKKRIHDINPDCRVDTYSMFYSEDSPIPLDGYDFIIDAIDSISSKVFLAKSCQRYGVPLISCMGTGNKTDPTKLKVDDIYKTSVCPLARVMRQRLKKEGIKKLQVVYSTEESVSTGERTPGSLSFVPGCAGLILASRAVEYIINKEITR